jgi:hypothetical protein
MLLIGAKLLGNRVLPSIFDLETLRGCFILTTSDGIVLKMCHDFWMSGCASEMPMCVVLDVNWSSVDDSYPRQLNLAVYLD